MISNWKRDIGLSGKSLFLNFNNWGHAKKVEHANEMDTLKCDQCQSEFFSKATKSIHDMMYHDMPKTESFLCKHCSEVAGSLYEIVKHHQGSDFVLLNLPSIL